MILKEYLVEDLKYVKYTENPYYRKNYLVKAKRKLAPPKNKILLGIDQRGKKFYLDIKEVQRILLLGKTGCGKSFLLRRIMSQLYFKGYAPVILVDVKDEFKYSLFPVQEEYLESPGLPPEEKPHTLPMKIYRPTFFKERKLASHNLAGSVKLSDLTLNDLNTLLGTDEMSLVQRELVGAIARKIQNEELNSFEEIDKFIIDKNNSLFVGLNVAQRKAIQIKFRMLKDKDFCRDDYAIDLVGDISEGKIPVLNMKNFEMLGARNGLPQAMVAIWLRQLKIAKSNSEIEPLLWIFIDELARFAPATGEPTSKKEIMEAVDVTRGFGINFIFGAQRLSNIATNIAPQCRYILLPYNAEIPDIIKAFETYGIAPALRKGYDDWGEEIKKNWSHLTKQEIARAVKKRMGKYDWLVLDTDKASEIEYIDDLSIVSPYAPNTMHPTKVS